MEPPTPPQKRRASISHASSQTKRARSISISVKVYHHTTPVVAVGDPEIPVIPKTPQACLGGLPEELILNIFKLFDSETLAKLCQTDERCKRISEELLYREVRDIYDGQIKAIARNGSLAKDVKMIRLVFCNILSLSPGESKTSRQEKVQAMVNITNVQRMTLVDSLRQNLKRKVLAQGEDWLELFNNALSNSDVVSPNQFVYLKELRVTSGRHSVAEVSCLFRLPALEALVLNRLYQTTELENWTLPEASCHLQHLELKYALMDVAAVAQILSSMKALRSFLYYHSTHDWEPFSEGSPKSQVPFHSWNLLGDALRKHKHSESLEKLEIAEYTDKFILALMYPDGRHVGTLGSLRDFSKLQVVTAHMSVFLDDLLCLPRQLTKLRTNIDQGDSKPWMSASRS